MIIYATLLIFSFGDNHGSAVICILRGVLRTPDFGPGPEIRLSLLHISEPTRPY